MKILYIIRGVPGSGKSTLARQIAPNANFAADDYFDLFHDGEFVPSKIKAAHNHCHLMVETALSDEMPFVAVHNTFTQQWEYQPYLDLAEKYGYRVHMMVVENQHNGESVHGVSQEVIEKMRDRFEINL